MCDSLCKGAQFECWNDFAETLERYCDSSFEPILTISECKTVATYNRNSLRKIPEKIGYYHCTINCLHYGSYESSSKGIRPEQKSASLGCGARVKISYDKKSARLVVRECSLHDKNPPHPISKETYDRYPINRGLRGLNFRIKRCVINASGDYIFTKENPEATEKRDRIKLLINNSVQPHKIRQYASNVTKVSMTSYDVRNARAKHRLEANPCGKSNFELMLDYLNEDLSKDKDMVVDVKTSGNVIASLFWQFGWLRRILHRYPEHLLMDGTYCLNECRMTLYIAMVVDGNNNSVPVAFSIVKSETNENTEHFFLCLIKHNDIVTKKTRSFITDKQFTELNMIKKHFPQAKSGLCTYHVSKSFNQLVKESSLNQADSDRARDLLERMINSFTRDDFQQALGNFITEFKATKLLHTFEKNWMNCSEQWAGYEKKLSEISGTILITDWKASIRSSKLFAKDILQWTNFIPALRRS